MAEDVSIAVKTYDHRDVDAWMGTRGRRRFPAGPQFRNHVMDGIDLHRLGLRRQTPQGEQRRSCKPDERFATPSHHPHLISDATCTFTILSGSVTVPLEDPAGAFFNLSITSIPDTTSPITVYCPFRLGASVNMKKNCEFAVSTLSPRRAMPTMPRLNGTLENSAFRLGYFEPPVPLKFWPSPVCAMKPSITRWNGTLL